MFVLQTNPAVQKPAEQYYFLRVLGLPSQLLAMAVVGILQGYKRVYLVATINIGRLVFECAARSVIRHHTVFVLVNLMEV